MTDVFLVLKKSIRYPKNVISGEISAVFFIKSTKRFVFEFQGESLEHFLSYRVHFRRYQHLRGFRQSIASSFRIDVRRMQTRSKNL